MAALLQTARDFAKLSEGTRDDFHEPDEQGIELRSIVGTKLDNAHGTDVKEFSLQIGTQEIVLFLEREREVTGFDSYVFNLADIFALAKVGANAILKKANES